MFDRWLLTGGAEKAAYSATRARSTPELGEILRVHGNRYLAQHRATVTQERVLRAPSEYCTAALGGHLEACDGCGHRRAVYHSCRNRHSLHPHLHCVVTGGMLSADAERFEKSRSKGFLFPVRALTKVYRKVYRDKFLDGLRQAFKA